MNVFCKYLCSCLTALILLEIFGNVQLQYDDQFVLCFVVKLTQCKIDIKIE